MRRASETASETAARRLKWNEYRKQRRAQDPVFRLAEGLRCRLYQAIRKNTKRGSAIRDLGCTIAELWAHLESKFRPGMTRDNMGTVWEVDHVYPLARADLAGNHAEFLAANNWRNLQPLPVAENSSKNDTVTPAARLLFSALVAEFSARENSAA